MPVIIFPLLIIGGFVVLSLVTAEQRKRQEALRRAEEQKRQTASAQPEQKKPLTPVQPSVQIPKSAWEAAPAPQANPNRPVTAAMQTEPKKQQAAQMHPGHDLCALRPEEPKAKQAEGQHPEHDLCALRPDEIVEPEEIPEEADASVPATNSDILSFTPDNILRGVVFSEIFGKPKATR